MTTGSMNVSNLFPQTSDERLDMTAASVRGKEARRQMSPKAMSKFMLVCRDQGTGSGERARDVVDD